MKILFTLFAVVQLQLIDYNTVFRTVSGKSHYWKHNKTQKGMFEFSPKINKFRGMYNPSYIGSNNEKTMAQLAKKSRMERASKIVKKTPWSVPAAARWRLPTQFSTLVKTKLYKPIELMYQWYGSCHKRLINQETETESY